MKTVKNKPVTMTWKQIMDINRIYSPQLPSYIFFMLQIFNPIYVWNTWKEFQFRIIPQSLIFLVLYIYAIVAFLFSCAFASFFWAIKSIIKCLKMATIKALFKNDNSA